MRVVALLVVLCGCRAAASSSSDAGTARGEGLPDRVITDVAMWSDLPPADALPERSSRADGAADLGRDGAQDVPTGSDGRGGDAVAPPGTSCPLLGSACVGDEGCYPFPFESPAPGDTRCAFQGVSGPSIPCQSQLDCDELSLCAAPGEPDSVCLQRCSLGDPRCPTGFQCQAYFGYSGVGVCR